MANYLKVLILLISFASVMTDWLDGNDGVDRRNGDLPGMPMSLNNTNPPSQCAMYCQQEPKCLAWAYCKPNCGGVQNPLCYLKGTVTSQSLDPCRVNWY